MQLKLQLIPGELAVCRLEADAAVPAWSGPPGFSSVTRTADELSIVCTAMAVPADIKAERGWRLLQVAGPLDFGAVGILNLLTGPLARAGVSLLALGTFDTDYLLVKAARLEDAIRALEAAGHRVTRA